MRSFILGIIFTLICLAVGSYRFSFGSAPLQLAEHLRGRTWKRVRTPEHRGVLAAVSCTALRCIAVGQAGGLNTRTLAERWDGIRLRLMRTPNP